MAVHPAKFFVGVSGLDIPLTPIPGIKIAGDLRLMRDSESAERAIGSYISQIGSVEYSFLRQPATSIIYENTNIDLAGEDFGEQMNGFVINRLEACQVFLNKLWLIKDNSISTDIAWMAVNSKDVITVNSNKWSVIYSKADGSRGGGDFSNADIKEAVNLPLETRFHVEAVPVQLYVPGAAERNFTKLGDDTVRVQRFMYFVNGARSTMDVAIKVANYCSGLEALVSSSHSELTHQVAERVAVALCSRSASRVEVYEAVKTAYSFRSKAVHGAMFRDKEREKLINSSIAVDEICRKLARRYISDDIFRGNLALDSSEFTKFWQRELLS